MHPSLRVVVQQPLAELWRQDGFLTAQRGPSLAAEDLAALLRRGRLHFVVASAGEPLRWINPADCFTFWQREVKAHLAAPDAGISLSSFPGEYCYSASLWSGEALPIILLETHH